MFPLSRVSSLEKEYEPLGLFDKIILDLKNLKQQIFKFHNGVNFESDQETYFQIVSDIDLIEDLLKNPGDNIDASFFSDLFSMLGEIQRNFEILAQHQLILKNALKAIRDNQPNVINDSNLVTDISYIRHGILKLINHTKQLEKSNQNGATIYRFPNTQFDEVSHPDLNEPLQSQANITTDSIRKQVIQRLAFDKSGEILPDMVVNKKQKEIRELIGEAAYIDTIAANDEIFPDNEMSDQMIMRAIKQAKARKDGGFIQSIKNNLVKNAISNIGEDPHVERSLLLADHIKNLSSNNPIHLETVEYGKIKILSIKTIDHGDMTCYDAIVEFPNGKRENLLLSANAFVVGDLSNKIIGKIDNKKQLQVTNAPCTIRRMSSNINSMQPTKVGILSSIGNKFTQGLQSLKKRFSFL